MKFKWEKIDPYHQRAKVPGGWALKSIEDVYTKMYDDTRPLPGCEYRSSICFIPDTNHEWEIDSDE